MTDEKKVQSDARADWDVALRWWAGLVGEPFESIYGKDSVSSGMEPVQTRGNPGALARLRRARSPLMALLEPEALELISQMGCKELEEKVQVAMLATLLAHVRENVRGQYMATALGGPNPDERLMKSARFRRLMDSEAGMERHTSFRRAIYMLRRSVNVRDLCRGWLLWDHPMLGERVKTQWMLNYVGASKGEFSGKKLTETNNNVTQES